MAGGKHLSTATTTARGGGSIGGRWGMCPTNFYFFIFNTIIFFVKISIKRVSHHFLGSVHEVPLIIKRVPRYVLTSLSILTFG